jgi:diadenosine tetraphosphate (Ap4A) HIT family hydrolase
MLEELKTKGNALRPMNSQTASSSEKAPYDKAESQAASLKAQARLKAIQGQKVPVFMDPRTYSPGNIFYKLIHKETGFSTHEYPESAHTITFDDLRKRTKEHFLVVPKGNYISFPHFMTHASDQEVVDLLHEIARIAESKKLDQTGYRIASNHAVHFGRTSQDNDANQEVPYFHIHVVGGEALGKPITGDQSNKYNMGIWNVATDLPFGFGIDEKALLSMINKNKIAARNFTYHTNKTATVLAYRVPSQTFGIPYYIEFVILGQDQKPMFHSFHDFAKDAAIEIVKPLLDFVKDVAAYVGIYETGYRIVANHGVDALQPSHSFFQFFLAGGTRLGITATNIYNNENISFAKGVLD